VIIPIYIAPYQNGKVMNVTVLSVHTKAQLCSATGGQYLTWAYNSSAVFWGNRRGREGREREN
jgi:hypothetical protein